MGEASGYEPIETFLLTGWSRSEVLGLEVDDVFTRSRRGGDVPTKRVAA